MVIPLKPLSRTSNAGGGVDGVSAVAVADAVRCGRCDCGEGGGIVVVFCGKCCLLLLPLLLVVVRLLTLFSLMVPLLMFYLLQLFAPVDTVSVLSCYWR